MSYPPVPTSNYAPATQQAPYSVAAIIGLVAACLGIGFLALILGLAALEEMREAPEAAPRGRTMAIVAISLGAVETVFGIALLALWILGITGLFIAAANY
jgi:ABC-type arginine transport system permease subunit